jgi:hypothetical protein
MRIVLSALLALPLLSLTARAEKPLQAPPKVVAEQRDPKHAQIGAGVTPVDPSVHAKPAGSEKGAEKVAQKVADGIKKGAEKSGKGAQKASAKTSAKLKQ